MNSRVSRLQVRFEVDGDGRVVRALGGIADSGDKAAKSLDRAADAADRGEAAHTRLTSAAKAAGTVLGTVFSAGVSAMSLYVFNTIQAQKEQAQLTAVLKSTGEAAGFTQARLNEMADDFAEKSRLSAGEITNAQTRLLSYSNIVGETFPRALQAAIDQQERLGISAEQSAEIVGRALGEPTKAMAALAQQGFSFDETTKKLIKTLVEQGKTAEAQSIILDSLEESYGGAAQAARNTLGGALEELLEAFNDLIEGDGSSQGVEDARQSIELLISTLRSPEVQSAFAQVAAGVAEITSEIAAAIPMILEFNRQLQVGLGLSVDAQGKQGGTVVDLFKGSARAWSGLAEYTRGYVSGDSMARQTGLNRLRQGDSQFRAGVSGDPFTESYRNPAGGDIGRLLGLPDYSGNSPGFSAVPFPLVNPLPSGNGPPRPKKDKDDAKARAAAARAAAAALREQERAEREAARAARELDQAQRDAMASIEDWRAELAGPVAQVMLEYQRMQADLDEQFAAGILTHERYAEAMELTAQMRERDLAAAERQMNPAAELIEQMREELRLRTLNNAEARTAIDLARLGGQATAEQAQEIFNINRAMVEQERTIAVMDTFRSSLADLGVTAVRNFGDAKEAFADMMQGFADEITRRILEQWIDQLFGSQGSTGAGTGGGGLMGGLLGGLFGGGNAAGSGGEQAAYDRWFNANNGGGGAGGGWMGMLGSLVGSWFGGGRAYGGGTKRGRMYDVNEIQPELLEYGGRTMLMMGSRDGNVRPVPRATTGGDTYNINVPVQGHVDARTRNQVAGETARAISRSRRLRS